MANEQRELEDDESEYSYQTPLSRLLDNDSQTTVQDDQPTLAYDLGMEDFSNLFGAEDFDFLSGIDVESFEIPDNLFGDDLTEMANLLNILMPEHSGPQTSRLTIFKPPSARIAPGRRKRESISVSQFIGRKGILYENHGSVYYKTDSGEVIVGKVKRKTGQVVRYSTKGIWDRANLYNEEVSNKGSGLGFSMFLHMAVCLCIARSGRGVLEPDEGGDVAVNQVLVEVGGQSYQRKITHCDWVLSKYLLITASVPDVQNTDYYRLSVDEDQSEPGSYYSTPIDNPPSPYTHVVRKLAQDLSDLVPHQVLSISKMWLHWFANHIQETRDDYSRPVPRSLDSGPIWQFIDQNSKNGMVPCPFKVLCPKSVNLNSLLDANCRSSVHVDVFAYTEGASTYHVNPIHSDPTSLLWNKTAVTVDRESDTGSIHEIKLQHFMKYTAFQYAYLMSELLPKITGKQGSYYSKYSKVGISWGRLTRSSLVWYVCFYIFDELMDTSYIGKWERVEAKLPYSRSPVFKVSRNDLHFASTLPYKFLSMHAACVPLLNPSEIHETEQKLASILMCWVDSSWRTSVIAGSSRFTVCCHMSQSGDLQTLFEKGLVHQKPLRFPDYLYLRLITRYIENSDHISYTQTPLFGLPIPLMSLEKDIPQGMNWHVRTANHDNDCMTKLIDNHKEEIETRHKRIVYLEKQHEFLDKAINSGCSQDDFNKLMDHDIGCITLNIVYFIAMSSLSSNSHDKLAPMRGSQKIALWPLITDHHSMVVEGEVRTGRVRELFSKLLQRNKVTHGFYELLTKQLAGKQIRTSYAMHMKDAKSADRDISIMDINCRPFQYFTESLVSTYNNSISEDMMTDSEKYTKVVDMCVRSLRRNKSVVSSEDRSNFCGYMHPELMGLGVFAVGREYNSTGLRAAGSVLLTNTNREVIFPYGYSDFEKLTNLDVTMVTRKEQKEQKKVPKITVNIHMMQGIYANTGGLINTVCVTGMAETLKILTEDRVLINCATTSDDVVRVVDYSRNFPSSEVQKIAIDYPNDFLNMSMMKENKTKPIVSTNLAEFNNIVITRDGMVPQGPIHSVLVHQPLYGNTPMTDLISCISSARSTLFWGDSPDLAESALFGNVEMFKQKWLITSDQWDLLLMNKIVPTKMSELISGFFPRSSGSLATMWWSLEPEIQEQVLKGMMSIASACHVFAEDEEKKPKKVPKIDYLPKTLHRVCRSVKTIGVMRKVSSRLNPRYVQPIHFTKRRDALNRTLDLLLQESREVPQEVSDLISPPRIKIHLERHRKKDQRPTKMGMSAQLAIPNLSNLRSFRFCKVGVGTLLNEEEQSIVELDDQNFELKEAEIERLSRHQGISYKSPGGLPLTRMFDGRFFRVPMSFNFSVHLKTQYKSKEEVFSYRGSVVHDFQTCKWGNDSLEDVEDSLLAFGTGLLNGQWVAFFKKPNTETLAIEIENVDKPQVVRSRQRERIGVFKGKDASPIGAHHFKRSLLPDAYLPGVTGDLTAIINHGSYLLSEQKGGFSIYRQLYKQRGSEMPIYCQKYMLPYPTYCEPVVKIKPANTTILKGNFCCLNLEFDGMPSDEKTITIDLEGDEPVVVETNRRRRRW